MKLTLCTTTEIRDIRAEADPGIGGNTVASLILYQDGWNMLVHIMSGVPGAFDRFERIAAIFNEPNSTAAEKSSDDFDVSMSR